MSRCDSVADIKRMRQILSSSPCMQILVKITSLEGLENFEEILKASDGIICLRGILGATLPAQKSFIIQKYMLSKASALGKPSILMAELLESMTWAPRPTRAESADLANAIIDGANCIALGQETSIGSYPLETVEISQRIIEEAEMCVNYFARFCEIEDKLKEKNEKEGICAMAVNLSFQVNAPLIIIVGKQNAIQDYSQYLIRFSPSASIFILTLIYSFQPILFTGKNQILRLEVFVSLKNLQLKLDNPIKEALKQALQMSLIQINQEAVVLEIKERENQPNCFEQQITINKCLDDEDYDEEEENDIVKEVKEDQFEEADEEEADSPQKQPMSPEACQDLSLSQPLPNTGTNLAEQSSQKQQNIALSQLLPAQQYKRQRYQINMPDNYKMKLAFTPIKMRMMKAKQPPDNQDFLKATEDYFEKNKLRELFRSLTKQLVTEQPKNPIDYLINFLDTYTEKRVYILNGQPKRLIKSLANNLAMALNFENLSFYDYEKEFFQDQRFNLDDDFTHQIQELSISAGKKFFQIIQEKYQNENQNQGLLISGYPNNLSEAIALQQNAILPNKFFIIQNESDNELYDSIKKQLEELSKYLLGQQQIKKLTEIQLKILKINERDIMSAYENTMTLLPYNQNMETQVIFNRMLDLITFNLLIEFPKRFPRILIIHPKGIHDFAKKLAPILSFKYDLQSIICSEQLQQQVANKTEIGKFIYQSQQQKLQVPDDIVSSVIKTKALSQRAESYGFIMEGFPKTKSQFHRFLSWDLFPTLVVIMKDTSENFTKLLSERASYNEIEIKAILQEYKELTEFIVQKCKSVPFIAYSMDDDIFKCQDSVDEQLRNSL